MHPLEGFEEAFDNLVQGFGPETSTDDAALAAVGQLKATLLVENLPAIQALLTLRNTLSRPYFCAALSGASRYLLHIAGDPRQQAALTELSTLLTTKKGQPKKVLRDAEWQRLSDLNTIFVGKPSKGILRDMTTYIQVVTGLGAIEPTHVYRLFAVGLWHPDRLKQSNTCESAQLAGVPEEKIAILQTALKEHYS